MRRQGPTHPPPRALACGLVTVLLAAPVVACGPSDGDPTSRGADQVTELALEADLRLGSMDAPPEEQFVRVGRILVGPDDGEIHVFESSDYTIRVFSDDGTHVRTFGRRGEGPGEFSFPGAMAVGPDTALVFGGRLLHVFDGEGNHLRSSPYAETPEGLLSVTNAAWSESGWIVTERIQGDYSSAREGRVPANDTILARRFDPATGIFEEPFASVEGPDTHLLGEVAMRRKLLAPDIEYTIGGNGRFFVSRSGDYEIEIWRSDGAREASVTHPVDRIPVTDDVMQAEIDRQLARLDSLNRPLEGELGRVYDMWKNDIRALGHADFRPVIGYLIADPDGRLLALRSDKDPRPFESGDESPWDVIAADGEVEGRFVAEPGVRLFTYDHPFVYGTTTDDLDVISVVRWRIVERE